MGFMQSYKRLDNLCRDINGIGVTGYIEDMQRMDGASRVDGWADDYYSLKHYRHIRNQIAHEANAEERNMCSDKDVRWIDSFYSRVMNQKDPLALYAKSTKARRITKTPLSKASKGHSRGAASLAQVKKHKKSFTGRVIVFFTLAVAMILILYFALL